MANNYKSRTFVLWFTGLSGSGKTTLGKALAEKFKSNGEQIEFIDGDLIRSIFPNTGYSKTERDEHIKRIAFLASRLEAHGVSVIVSLISPYEESRDFARKLCQNFIEVYLSTPLRECEERDVKGLYRKARRGEIKNFTGISDPYEIPENPDLIIDTSIKSIPDCVEMILQKVQYE